MSPLILKGTNGDLSFQNICIDPRTDPWNYFSANTLILYSFSFPAQLEEELSTICGFI